MSLFVILKFDCKSIKSIFSINSGIIERCADVSVYLVNNILCPFSNVNPVRTVDVENDFAEPLPPVTMKYLHLLVTKGVNLLFSFNAKKFR